MSVLVVDASMFDAFLPVYARGYASIVVTPSAAARLKRSKDWQRTWWGFQVFDEPYKPFPWVTVGRSVRFVCDDAAKFESALRKACETPERTVLI